MPNESSKGTRYHGLNNYILRHVSTLPLTTREIYNRILDEYGFVEIRTFYRRLQELTSRGHLIESISEYEIAPKYAYDTKCYAYRSKKKKNRAVFQKQYIKILNQKVLAIQSL